MRILILIIVLALAVACMPQATPTVTPTVEPPVTPKPIEIVTPGASSPESQLRAFWVDAFHPGIKSPQEVDQLIRDMQSANANAVFVQVRKRADAYYNKTLDPRADDLKKLPDYDPLAYLIQQAHQANPPIQVHAWLVAQPIGRRNELPTAPDHVYFSHGPSAQGDALWISTTPDGTMVAEENYFLDPGHPAAAQYIVDAMVNVVRNYDIDGIHLDYIRYAGTPWGYNPVNVARFNAINGTTGKPNQNDATWSQWRRDQVTNLMRQVYLESIALKPRVVVSAATIAWGAGPTNEDEWLKSRTMNETFQDWLGWMQEGIIDMALPMNYDREMDANQKRWFDDWIEYEKNHRADRHLVIGVGAYLNDVDFSIAQIRRALAPSSKNHRAQGVSIYSYASADARTLSFEKIASALTVPTEYDKTPIFQNRAVPPAMSWKTQPTTGYLKGFAQYADGKFADGLQATVTGASNRTMIISGTGFYGAANLPPGNYTLTVTRGGQTLTTATTKIEPGKVSTVDLKLP
jgi:uncharacterized lipoprotein YddW (UPF0748 family)